MFFFTENCLTNIYCLVLVSLYGKFILGSNPWNKGILYGSIIYNNSGFRIPCLQNLYKNLPKNCSFMLQIIEKIVFVLTFVMKGGGGHFVPPVYYLVKVTDQWSKLRTLYIIIFGNTTNWKIKIRKSADRLCHPPPSRHQNKGFKKKRSFLKLYSCLYLVILDPDPSVQNSRSLTCPPMLLLRSCANAEENFFFFLNCCRCKQMPKKR